MKIISVVENTTISSEYKAKHGLCLYIETAAHKILFDVGPDMLFVENAQRLNIDIKAIDIVVISHGHTDHGGGLEYFLDNNSIAKIYMHKNAFENYYTKVFGIPFYVGLDNALKNNSRIIFTEEEFKIDEHILLFSGVTEREHYSLSNNALFVHKDTVYKHDDFNHEQNLIITENETSVLFAACAHNGIINIQKKAESIIHKPLTQVIAGFHLCNPVFKKTETQELICTIANSLKANKTHYYTCHCTGIKPYKILKNIMKEKIDYISTGSIIEI